MPSGVYKHKKGFKQTEEFRIKTSLGIPKAEKSRNWKGLGAGMVSKHEWIRKLYGYPEKCVDCGLLGEKVNGRWNLHWSNVDHKYGRGKDDYVGRCPKCHKKYDRDVLKVKMGRKKIDIIN